MAACAAPVDSTSVQAARHQIRPLRSPTQPLRQQKNCLHKQAYQGSPGTWAAHTCQNQGWCPVMLRSMTHLHRPLCLGHCECSATSSACQLKQRMLSMSAGHWCLCGNMHVAADATGTVALTDVWREIRATRLPAILAFPLQHPCPDGTGRQCHVNFWAKSQVG